MIDIEELRRRHEEATPGPWSEYNGKIINRAGEAELGNWFVAEAYWERDRALIIYLRNAVPDILAIRKENARLREALNDMVGSTLGAKTGAGDGDTYAVYPPSPQALASARRALENPNA